MVVIIAQEVIVHSVASYSSIVNFARMRSGTARTLHFLKRFVRLEVEKNVLSGCFFPIWDFASFGESKHLKMEMVSLYMTIQLSPRDTIEETHDLHCSYLATVTGRRALEAGKIYFE
jgi:hypothetical protein